MEDQPYEQCINCKSDLNYEYREVGGFEIGLGYCPSDKCIRYLLFTLETPVAKEDTTNG